MDDAENGDAMTAALARHTDPETSHLAAELMDATGTAANNRAKCLAILRWRPGATAAEIATFTGLERHEPSRRLPELRKAGLVRNGEARICVATGNRSLTWWPL